MNLRQIFLIVATAGIVIAFYHAYDEIVHYSTSVSNVCSLSSTFSCSSVFAWSHPFGIPLYIFGIIWFPEVVWIGYCMNPLKRKYMVPFLMIGNLFTVYLLYLDFVIIWPIAHAVCPVCLSMYFLNYALTILAAFAD